MYVREIDGQTRTLQVSGKLWNRSLVMRDTETGSLWSHILGLCVEGKHKGTRLETIPSDMLTWSAWKSEFPETTVLKMSRTNRNYTDAFYTSLNRFVVGIHGRSGMCHVPFSTLKQSQVVNLDARGAPIVAVYDSDSTSARLFARSVGQQVLTFELAGVQHFRDKETGSLWDRSGTAIEGELKGQALKPYVGIVSFTKSWMTFHPRSVELTAK